MEYQPCRKLAPDIEAAVLQHLIPAIYLERVAGRCSGAEERRRLAALSALDHPIQALEATRRTELFQRSSSAVEGRNGQLSFAARHGERSEGA
nr:DUF6399 domain-containing protein [Halochromatium salexigens]